MHQRAALRPRAPTHAVAPCVRTAALKGIAGIKNAHLRTPLQQSTLTRKIGPVTSGGGATLGHGLPSLQPSRRSVPCRVTPNQPPALQSFSDLDEGRNNPLVQALDQALALLAEKARVCEALEAEAQEVALLAVEANEARDKAKAQVLEVSAMIDEMTRMQQQYAALATTLQEQLPSATSEDQRRALKYELSTAEQQSEEISKQLTELRAKLENLYEQADAAEAAAVRAEQIAAGAMKAAETAVKEEMQAAAVVKETEAALGKALKQLDKIEDGSGGGAQPQPSAAATAAAAAVATAMAAVPETSGRETLSAVAMASMDEIDAKQSAAGVTGAAAVAAKREEDGGRLRILLTLAVLAAAAFGVNWALHNTDAGMKVLATVQEKLSHIHVHEGEKGVVEAIWLLCSSIICVPLVVKLLPGGNPVLGYLLAGAIVGPHALGLISAVESVKHLAELGVVFLLFNIGLELSVERLASMAKYVFGMGTFQVLLSLAGVAAVAVAYSGLQGPSAIILGGALAMSSTAVAIQVLEDRGEMGSRHGRATFSVLLLQDLAVVVLLMLIPLLAPGPDGSSGGLAKIFAALGNAAVKACVCIVGIMAGGRLLIQPLYKWMSSFANAEIFAATTLLVVLGTSVLTSLAGLSLALGAFLAGLLIAETEYALQVESDIAPYKGLLLGLFFMSVGMEISAKLFIEKWQSVLAAIVVLIVGKVGVMALVGPMFGLTRLAAIRAGLLLAPGGEFAFVAFGESVQRGILPGALSNELYLVVALSMALTPYLAEFGARMGGLFEKGDVKALQPQDAEMKELRDHVIIAGYGRAGQLIGQLLSENLIPFVALDTSNERVATGKGQDLPVYFGDAGSPAVLHLVGAERAACAVIALDTPGANYRAVWAMNKHFPHVKTYVRAHDLMHGINLEKAGATAVVPEILEPSLQLAAAVLNQLEWNPDEVSAIMEEFRRKHLSELTALSASSGTSLGFGYGKPLNLETAIEQQQQQESREAGNITLAGASA